MAIEVFEVNVAPNIDTDEVQTGNFYFSVIFLFAEGESIREGDFGLFQISVLGDDSEVDLDNVSLIQSNERGALFAMTLPRQANGTIKIEGGGFVDVNGEERHVIADQKVIKFDTRETFSDSTLDLTPPTLSVTTVDLTLSAAHVEWGDTIIAQIDFDFDMHNFSSLYLHLSHVYATKGDAEAIDEKNRRWIVPITAPSSGEGTFDVFIPANSLPFSHTEKRVTVNYAEHIPLVIEPG